MSVKVLVVLALTVWLAGYTSNAADQPAKISPSIAQVVKMHESGVAPDVLLAYVKETPVSKPNADEVLYLTEKGIPKDVIVVLLSKRVWTETPPAQSQPAPAQPQAQTQQLPPAVATTQPATQSVVYVQQAAPVVTYASTPYYPYYPYYYSPWYYPRFSVGIGFGQGWCGPGWNGHGGWNGGHHGGGIHVHHR